MLVAFAFTLWSIWKARNSKVFQAVPWSEEETGLHAKQAHWEYEEAQRVLLQKVKQTERKFAKVPRASSFSINRTGPGITISYDGGINARAKSGSVAGLARNAQGEVLGTFAKSYRGIWDPGILEFLALREAIFWAKNKGWRFVVFEGDAIQVSNSVNSGECSLASSWGICQDIWLSTTSFDYCQFRWIKRQENKEAHRLVQLEKASFRRTTAPTIQNT
ncbi:uncharacterized protein LOC126660502 [Mercurialis annua]|uniref:uncharacterized protein LOC126660502 n=1 Tax=Mercurialis annua TaxID=3986 RepID=UPI00215E58FF|nr:uncharacterized protein LOC126660502 [Mercurialis annua]